MLMLIAMPSVILILIFPIVWQVKSLGVNRGIAAGVISTGFNALGFIIFQPIQLTAEDWLISTLLLLCMGIITTQYLMKKQDHETQTTQIANLKAKSHQLGMQLQAFKTALPDRAFIYDENGYYVDVISQLITPEQQQYLIGKHVTDTPEILKSDTALKLLETIQQTVQTGEVQQLEYQAFTSREQQWCWLQGRTALLEDPQSSKKLVIWVARDITQQKQLQENLTKVQRLAHIGTWETDISANYVEWSDEVYSIYGITPSDFDHTIEWVISRIHPEDLIGFQDNIEKGIHPYPTEYRIIRPDGTLRTVFAVGEAIYNEDGQLTKRIGLLQDITERKQAEQDRFQLQSEKQHTLALYNLISNVTHDIMSPLTIIKTSLYILSKTNDTTKQHNHLNQIKTRVEMLQKLFENLLQVSYLTSVELDHLSPKQVNLVTLLRGLSHQYIELAQHKHQTLTTQLPDQSIMMWLDEEYMWKAISNILQNAIQYTPQGGQILLSLSEQGKDLVITVEDNGEGISEDHQKYILDGFYRVDEHRPIDGSSGLGLYMSNLIVMLHGGTIGVESTVDVGSKFHVILPKTETVTA